MQRQLKLYSLLSLLATHLIPVDSLVIPAQSDLCNPSLQLCLNQTITDAFRVIESIDLSRRAGGGGGKGGKGKDPEPVPVPGSGSSGGGNVPSTPGGSTGNGGFETGETTGGFESADTEGGFGQPTPDEGPEPESPVAPEPIPDPAPEPQPGRPNPADEEMPVVVQNARALATLERWKCGRTKRDSLFSRLFKRAYTSEDATDPAKYLEWLENMGKDGKNKIIPRDKIVFYTQNTKIMSDKFVAANPEYHSFDTIFESEKFMDDWAVTLVPAYEKEQAKSEALAKYARNPLVFGAAQTISASDKSMWATKEWPYMQDAGTITKLKDNALSPTQVDYQIAPPEKQVC